MDASPTRRSPYPKAQALRTWSRSRASPTSATRLKTFAYVVANPPFSDKDWSIGTEEKYFLKWKENEQDNSRVNTETDKQLIYYLFAEHPKWIFNEKVN
jgi:type I restriction-modification system DNA methylase subunit